jgi:hypothetical protein
MAEFKLSRLKYTWRGEWDSSVSYNPDDVVSFGAKVYTCLVSHTSFEFNADLTAVDTSVPPAAVPRWEKIADGARWLGEWAIETVYQLGDVVRVNGTSYLCTTAHTSEIDLGNTYDQQNFYDQISNWTVLLSAEQWYDEWQPQHFYNINDIIRYGGKTYRCIQAHPSSANLTTGLEANQESWEIVSIGNDWKGEWSINFKYKVRDIVKYGGYVYQCNTAHISTINSVDGLLYDLEKWDVLFEGVEYRGDYSTDTSVLYKPNDIVRYGSYLYITDQLFTADIPFNSLRWQVYVPGLEFDTAWSSIVAYQIGDVVRYGGNLYISVAETLDEAPDTSASWNLLFQDTRIQGNWSISTEYRPGDTVRRGGNLYYSLTTNTGQEPDIAEDGSTTNSDHWRLITESIRWRGVWEENVNYIAGDTVVWVSSSYKCRDKHFSSQLNRPDDDPLIGMGTEDGAGDSTLLGTYWEKITEGYSLNRLQEVGDIRTFGDTGDGSSVGFTKVSIGTTGQSLIVNNNGAVEWTNWSESQKVYYVAPTGIDDPTQGTSPASPWRTVRYACENITGYASIFVRTGVYEEILPIKVPAFVAIIGDELRSTVIKPAPQQITDAYKLKIVDAINYFNTIGKFIVREIEIGNDDPEEPETTLYGELRQDFTGTPATEIESGILDILTLSAINKLSNGINPTLSGTNIATTDADRLNAISQLTSNRTFIKNEITLYLQAQDPTFVVPSRWTSDLDRIIDSYIYDIRYPGNFKTTETATFFVNSNDPVVNKSQNMFLLRDGTGLRNMTLVGLEGQLTPPVEALVVNQRPTAGAYASLDPGWGVSDSSVWVGTKSPYVQNVTTFGTACVGLKVDGDLHAGGNQTIVSNDFTQILSDGIGVWCNGTGRSECVSVFTYYNHIGYLCTLGGKIRGTNGNCSYGRFGAVSEGSNTAEEPITAKVNNFSYEASVNFVQTKSGQLQKFFFDNAGVDYTQATFTITGAGINAAVEADEFRDGSVFELRIMDPGDSSAVGGSGYVFNTNAAQSGNDLQVQLAGSDTQEPDAYKTMRLYLGSGTGVGQYGYIAEFEDTGKYAWIAKESTTPVQITETTSVGNLITYVPGATELAVDMPVIFTAETHIGNIQPETVYYITTIGANTFTVSTSVGGADFNLINATGAMVMHFLGWEHIVSGTPIESTLDSTSNYFIEPRLQFSSPGVSTAASTLPASRQWTSIASNQETFVVVGLDTTSAALSIDAGANWTTTTLPSQSLWTKVKYVGDRFMAFATGGQAAFSEDGTAWSAMTMPSGFEWRDVTYGNDIWIAVAVGGSTAAKSTDGETWTTFNLPEGADWNSIEYGKGRFLALALSDSSLVNTAISLDGTTWTLGSYPGSAISLAYGNNRWVAISGGYGTAQESFISFDGATWVQGTLPAEANWQNVTYGQGVFIAVANGESSMALSYDGVSWEDYTLGGSAPWCGVAFGNMIKPGKFLAISGSTSNSTIARTISTGVTTQARAVVVSGRISEFRIWEPGSGYESAPVMTITDPNNNGEVNVDVRIGNGVIASPSIVSEGSGWATTSTRATIVGDGYRDQYQIGTELVISDLTRIPGPGDNISISGIDDYTYKLLTATVLSGSAPSYNARITIAKDLGRDESPEHGTDIEIRQLYSQVRLTGHDFLDIGLGNFIETNYPDTLFPIGTVIAPENEVAERGGGRVFYTSTDQDGNFRVGELFAVEQSTGTVTLNAQFFELQGLEELRLGGVTVGGTGVVVREFSTDPLFIADSNNVVPTQAAIRAFINRRVSGGGADAVTGALTAGVVTIGPNLITTTTGDELIFENKVNFKGGIDGDWLIHSYFLSSGA